ncbi:uncharacterized protein CDAR_606961 [Caerostris darwini]|uniref:Gustatory receptor n=1 Tax=Caerostris darwini TaxID=1538125 RepID=A0AAV4QZS8_9ARAC|nr:uncharacterized protein CDAR_606961 [Caerostris darwini]
MLFEKNRVKNFRNSEWILEDKFRRACTRNHSFNIIFDVGLFIGLPLSSSIIKENRNDIGIFAKIWSYVVAAIKTIMFLISLGYITTFLPMISMSITFYGYIVCGYLTMILFFRNRMKLFSAIKNLIHLSTVMNPGVYIGSRYINIQIISFFVSVILLEVCITVFFFYEHHEFYVRTIYFPSFIPAKFKETYTNFIGLCIVATFGLSVSTCGYVFLLCTNLYETLANLICVYGDKLKERSQRMPWNVETIPIDINIFKHLIFRIHEIDAAINMYVFFLYGALISGFFNTVSVMVNDNAQFKTPSSLVYIIWVVVSAVTVLLFMSSRGSNICEKDAEVKRRMVEYSDQFIRYSPPLPAMQVFNLLFEIVTKTNMIVTGGGMFVINYGLILTIASVMVTYGVLILQMDQK